MKYKLNKGDIFGRLVVLDEKSIKIKNKYFILCQCSCPNKTVGKFRRDNLLNGHTTSCGCFHKESVSALFKGHGLVEHPLYHVWSAMKDRCSNNNNKGYKHYGGRGIYVCEEWKDNFQMFYDWCMNNDYSEGLDIDRRNNDGPYAPWNCRFVTRKVNIGNQRLIRSINTSGYCGVSYNKKHNKFYSQANNEDARYFKFGFNTAEEAAIARDIFIIKNGWINNLNFPELLFNSPV